MIIIIFSNILRNRCSYFELKLHKKTNQKKDSFYVINVKNFLEEKR